MDLPLPPPAKMAFLPVELGGQLDRINLAAHDALGPVRGHAAGVLAVEPRRIGAASR